MFDHMKCLSSWITMVYHVYNSTYYKMLTIVVCDMHSKDTKVQGLMWIKLNETILKHGFPKPNLKGFMVNNT